VRLTISPPTVSRSLRRQQQCSDQEITESIQKSLKREGIENPEQYLVGAKYIFLDRGIVDKKGWWPDVYDVVVMTTYEHRWPPYVYRSIVDAIRERDPYDDVTNLNVYFLEYYKLSGRYSVTRSHVVEDDPLGLNNCFFKQQQTIEHDDLRFRSKGEVAIYDELKQRDLLFFPNAAAVLGTSGTEYGMNVEKREPDFLICFKGKWGILEVNGDTFHSGVIQTAKDHDRARLFQRYGLLCIQAYPLDRCKGNPSDVVDDFLSLLEKYK
jgi:hypothetical protein